MVAWDGMPRLEADNAYKNLIPKLNKYGLPTTRRCATNENRTCACQGLFPQLPFHSTLFRPTTKKGSRVLQLCVNRKYM